MLLIFLEILFQLFHDFLCQSYRQHRFFCAVDAPPYRPLAMDRGYLPGCWSKFLKMIKKLKIRRARHGVQTLEPNFEVQRADNKSSLHLCMQIN